MKRPRNRNLPLKFAPYAKVVCLNYPDNIENPCCLEYCGTHWENLLTDFFRKSEYVLDVDTHNGMTAQAIEVFFKYDTPDETIEVICNQAIQLILDAAEPSFVIGARAIFTTSQYDLLQYNGQEVTIQRLLTEDECDIDEVGYMYEVKGYGGELFQAYEDELS